MFILKIVFVMWMGFMIYFSVTPAPDTFKDMSDKVIHFIAYFISTSLCYFAFSKKNFTVLTISGLIIFIYGLIIEVIQFHLPYREFQLGDIAANVLGIVAFITVIFLTQTGKRQI